MQIFKIFLASSGELKKERNEIALFIGQENKRLVKQDIFLELVIWEELVHSFKGERIQDYFNEEMLKCNIVIALFYKKIGQFTKEEFKIACMNLNKGKNLKQLFVFFKKANIPPSDITKDVMDVFKLQDEIEKAEQIYDSFISTQDLILKLKRQLDLVIPNEIERGKQKPLKQTEKIINNSQVGIIGDNATIKGGIKFG